MDREEMLSAEVEYLREENLTTKRNFESMTRVLSARRHVDALASDASAEEFIDAISDVNDTIKDLDEEWDEVTRRNKLLGAVGSHQTATKQFTIPRIPSTLTEPSPNKRTHSME